MPQQGQPRARTVLSLRPRPFRIQVVEEGTGRGVPLVELKTVNQVRYVTDSNGIVAFDEPGLFDHKIYFAIRSHGYEVELDGFGFRGAAFQVTAGGSARSSFAGSTSLGGFTGSLGRGFIATAS